MSKECSVLTPPASKKWMVIYTRSNWEKKSHQLLQLHGFRSFCPTIATKKQWADRMKTIETPLFKSYLFVYASLSEQSKILQIPGVINFVTHCRKPVEISDLEIKRIETIICSYGNVEVINLNNYNVGDNVVFNSGPFMSYQGEVTEVLGASILLVIEQLGCALVVKVSQNHITQIEKKLPVSNIQ